MGLDNPIKQKIKPKENKDIRDPPTGGDEQSGQHGREESSGTKGETEVKEVTVEEETTLTLKKNEKTRVTLIKQLVLSFQICQVVDYLAFRGFMYMKKRKRNQQPTERHTGGVGVVNVLAQ